MAKDSKKTRQAKKSNQFVEWLKGLFSRFKKNKKPNTARVVPSAVKPVSKIPVPSSTASSSATILKRVSPDGVDYAQITNKELGEILRVIKTLAGDVRRLSDENAGLKRELREKNDHLEALSRDVETPVHLRRAPLPSPGTF